MMTKLGQDPPMINAFEDIYALAEVVD